MPKRVDPAERRAHIVAALLRITARDGLGAVSLRSVAREAGVTAGAVQHYFPSKHSMLEYAMSAASERYEQRIAARIRALGEGPHPSDMIWALLSAFLPNGEVEIEDARVGLAFQAHAATDSEAQAHLHQGNAQLREFIAQLIRAANPAHPEAEAAATALFAATEGLAVHMLSSSLSLSEAQTALELLIAVAIAST